MPPAREGEIVSEGQDRRGAASIVLWVGSEVIMMQAREEDVESAKGRICVALYRVVCVHTQKQTGVRQSAAQRGKGDAHVP